MPLALNSTRITSSLPILSSILVGPFERIVRMQSIFRFACLPVLFVLGTITNLVEFSVSSAFLAYLAWLIEHNLQFCQDHKLIVTPLVCLVSFVVLAVPGYFTVRIMSRLAKENRL